MKTTRSGLSTASLSRTWSINVLPATVTSGFGLLQVCGLRRLPNPATGRTICIVPLLFSRNVNRLVSEELDVHGSMRLRFDCADTYSTIAWLQYVLAMAGTIHESCMGLFHVRCKSEVFPG